MTMPMPDAAVARGRAGAEPSSTCSAPFRRSRTRRRSRREARRRRGRAAPGRRCARRAAGTAARVRTSRASAPAAPVPPSAARRTVGRRRSARHAPGGLAERWRRRWRRRGGSRVERDAGQPAVQVEPRLLPALAQADVDGRLAAASGRPRWARPNAAPCRPSYRPRPVRRAAGRCVPDQPLLVAGSAPPRSTSSAYSTPAAPWRGPARRLRELRDVAGEQPVVALRGGGGEDRPASGGAPACGPRPGCVVRRRGRRDQAGAGPGSRPG